MSKGQGLGSGLTNYGDPDFARFLRRSFARSMGISRALLDRPVVGIAMTPSGFNNCHRGMPDLVEAVSRGVLDGRRACRGPFPDGIARRGLPQSDQHGLPQPHGDGHRGDDRRPADGRGRAGRRLRQDGAGAQLMGAASADLPAIQLVTGPMSTGPPPRAAARRLHRLPRASGRSFRAGSVGADEIATVEGTSLATTAGTCAVMGTASTMACIAEALGMSLPGTAAIPAVHADRLVAGGGERPRCGSPSCEEPIRPSEIVTEKSVENAYPRPDGDRRFDQCRSSISRRSPGRRGIRVSDEAHQRASRTRRRCSVDLKPVGDGYMEDFPRGRRHGGAAARTPKPHAPPRYDAT